MGYIPPSDRAMGAMRFQDHLRLQKQHAEELERQVVAQQVLDEASASIQAVYLARKRYRDPIEESRMRIRALQRRAASTTVGSNSLMAMEAYAAGTASSTTASRSVNQSVTGQAPPEYVSREVTVRHLNDHANLNPAAFKLYRKLRFG